MADLSSFMHKAGNREIISSTGYAPLVRSEPCYTASLVPQDVSLPDSNSKMSFNSEVVTQCYSSITFILSELPYWARGRWRSTKLLVKTSVLEKFSHTA